MTWPFAMLLATLAIELPIALLLLRRRPRSQVLLAASAASLCSHPVACLCIGGIGFEAASWLVVEVGVVAFEAVALRALLGCAWGEAFLVSLACNIASAAGALLVPHLP
ncbi:MAG: hypothetical protein RL112_443 [Planctomycetota bacterium]|jgi:hypothetical protein